MSPSVSDQSTHHPVSAVVLSLITVELLLGTTVTLLRTYTKFRLTPEAGNWSYFWALLSWILYLEQMGGVVDSAAMFMSASYGLGVQKVKLPGDAVVQTVKWSWISNAVTRIAGSFGRVAVVAFIFEIQKRTTRRWEKAFLGGIAISNLLFNICIVCFMFLRCTPSAYIWNRHIPGGSCPLEQVDQYLAYVFAAWGGFSDFLLACYPITIFWDLRIPRRVKIGISVLMGMGLLASAAAFVLTYEIRAVGDVTDTSYRLAPLAIWSMTEMWVILIASSAAPLWPLLRRLPCLRDRRRSPSTQPTITANAMHSSHTWSATTDTRASTLVPRDLEDGAESDGEKFMTPV